MPPQDPLLDAARLGDERAFASVIEPYRRELRAYCYRMGGALHEADDLLQESLLRAWKGLPAFEGRSSLRTWLYTVTTRACLDALEKRSARLLPSDLGDPISGDAPFGPPDQDPIWIEPCPDLLLEVETRSPEARYGARESVAFAFLVALQHLPARQRAVLILRDVVGWSAAECAELLDMSVAAANSALQRARETLALRPEPRFTDDAATRELLARYLRAWEEADVPALVSLLHKDATLAMPPIRQWVRGAVDIGLSIGRMVLTPDARGRYRLVPTVANGLPAFAAYGLDPAAGEYRPVALHVLSVSEGRIGSITAFLDPSLFGLFGLPDVHAGAPRSFRNESGDRLSEGSPPATAGSAPS
jgi:RNA polymerase sigma-70 factor (ECF subfamily)